MAIDVVRITPGLRGAAADAIADGFADNEIWIWLLGGERRTRRILPGHYRAVIRWIFAPRGGAWTTSDTGGGALWIPPHSPKPGWREQIAELASLRPPTPAILRRAARFDDMVGRAKPKQPHWYLNTLSIATGAQRQGLGSALIAPGLAEADRDCLGVYLETQRRANIPFYRRFGFEEKEEIKLPDSPPLWTMWRPPASER